MFDMSDPAIRDAAIKAGILKPGVTASPAQVRAGQRNALANAARSVSGEHRQRAQKIVNALDTMEGTSIAHGFIRAQAQQGGSGRQNAQAALDAQRQQIADATASAQDELKALKPAVLAAAIAVPQGVTDAQIADKKADFVAALEAVGKNPIGQNQKAQSLLRAAMANDDAVGVYVLLGPPMQYRAEALGYKQVVLQQIWAQAQIEKVGLHPLLDSQKVPGADLISLLPSIAEFISGHSSDATQALNQIAADTGLN